MFKLLFVFLLFASCIIAGGFIINNGGVVILELTEYRISMSLSTFVLSLILILTCFYIAYLILNYIFNIKKILSSLFKRKENFKHIDNLDKARLLLIQGNYKKASRLFEKNYQKSLNPTIVLLEAINVELQLKNFKKAESYLKIAAEKCKKHEVFAYKLTHLKLLIAINDFKKSNLLLSSLMNEFHNDTTLLLIAYDFYKKTEENQKVIDILPLLIKADLISKTEYEESQKNAYSNLIVDFIENDLITELQEWWNKQPRSIRKNDVLNKKIDSLLTKQLESINKENNQ